MYEYGGKRFSTKSDMEKYKKYCERVQKSETAEQEYRDQLTPFQQWFTRFLEEKAIDMSECTPQKGVQIGDVCSKIMSTSADEQTEIKKILVKIDFYNGDVYHFFNHLSGSISPEELEEIRGRALI